MSTTTESQPWTLPEPVALEPLLAGIPGWLTPAEAALLFDMARVWPGPGRVVELGSAQGRSTVCLALGLRARGDAPLLAVDTHCGSPEHQPGQPYFDPAIWDAQAGRVDTFPAFQRHIAERGLEPWVEPRVGGTLDAAAAFRGQVRLLFVDADHDAAAVRADLRAWLPHLAPGALVILHDVGSWPGPTAAVRELLDSGRFQHIQQADSAAALVFCAPDRPSGPERAGGRPGAHPLERAWEQALASDGAGWLAESGVWSWEPAGVRLEGGPEWATLLWSGAPVGTPPSQNIVIGLVVAGRAEAAGLSFGPYKDFLAELGPAHTERRLQLELDAATGRWAFLVDGRLMEPRWWNARIDTLDAILGGALALKARGAAEVSFHSLTVQVLQSSCRVSVLMICDRFLQRLRLALRAWCEQEAPAGVHEVLVINPDSPDGTREHLAAVARSYPHLRLREVAAGPGISRGALLNQAIPRCQGEWVWLAEADCLFSPDALARALARIDRHPDRLLYGEQRGLSAAQTAALLAGRLDPLRDRDALERQALPGAPPHPSGRAQIVHRALFERVRYREDVVAAGLCDAWLLDDCLRAGIAPRPIDGLLALHLDHPFAQLGTRTYL